MSLTAEHLLEAIQHDSAALSTAARLGLDAPVPSCPGWTVRDVVIHTGAIHRGKERVIRESLTSDSFENEPPEGDVVEWFDEGSRLMIEALRSVDPTSPMWSWFAPDQTAGFWYRRMAHETLIHRVDAELAHDSVTAIDPALADDGIDEALVVFIGGTPMWAESTPSESVIRLSTRTSSWLLREATFSGTTRSGRFMADVPAVLLEPDAKKWDYDISGDSAAVNLWLWGRGPLSDLTVTGDVEHARFLRNVAAKST